MKRRIGMLLFAALCMISALGLCEGYKEAFERARPGYVFLDLQDWGPTAAAIMEGEGRKVLLIAEKQNDAWEIVIDNPNALHPEKAYRLHVDSDIALYWSHTTEFNDLAEFCCFKGKDGWGDVSLRRVNVYDGGSTDLIYTYDGGALRVTRYLCDENENVLATKELMSIPGAWMEEALQLERFDIAKVPLGYLEMWEWPGRYAMEQAALELMPGYTYVDGLGFDDCLRMVLKRPDGRQVFVGVTQEASGFRVVESAPLPEGVKAFIGYENWESVLAMTKETEAGGEETVIELSPFADGRWGATRLTMGMEQAGPCFVTKDGRMLFCDHPFADITRMDWASLVLDKVYTAADASDWATPNNPDPADRLHLRTKPDKSAPSLGKYYNGTPVKVLGKAGDFTHVEVCGVEGYMMTKFLSFGEAIQAVSWASDRYFWHGDAALYEQPDGRLIGETGETPTVIGVVGEDWYHVWYPDTGLSGYVRQESLSPGEG